jgi:hypothetical protein
MGELWGRLKMCGWLLEVGVGSKKTNLYNVFVRWIGGNLSAGRLGTTIECMRMWMWGMNGGGGGEGRQPTQTQHSASIHYSVSIHHYFRLKALATLAFMFMFM